MLLLEFLQEIGGQDEKSAFEWCIKNNLLKSRIICPRHPDEQLDVVLRKDRKQFPWSFRCKQKKWLSVRTGTIFENCKLPLFKVLYFLYLWSMKGISQAEAMAQSKLAEHAAVRWTGKFRQVCRIQMEMELSKAKIGGNEIALR